MNSKMNCEMGTRIHPKLTSSPCGRNQAPRIEIKPWGRKAPGLEVGGRNQGPGSKSSPGGQNKAPGSKSTLGVPTLIIKSINH